MNRFGLRDMPKQNPCAQCGELIAVPDWVEEQEDRTVYLWRCRACDYRFEAVAYFSEERIEQEALAA